MRCFFYRIVHTNKSFLTSFIFISVFGCTAVAADSALPEPAFTTDLHIEQSVPYLTLTWDVPPGGSVAPSSQFELQVASSTTFDDPQTRYEGPDEAAFLSGLAEGEYFFRVRSLDEEGRTSRWSRVAYVKIQYGSLASAFLLFGIGAVISAATVALVVTGDRRVRREDSVS